jgi:photosystem II stability/assembly factor-like uncharacterized protein
VLFADAHSGWAVGADGTILAIRDGGASWSARVSGSGKNLLGVHFADARSGWAVILPTRDGGTTRSAQVSGTIHTPASDWVA